MKKCITLTDVKQLLLHQENIVIIDVRSPEEFLIQHIPAAINIPLNELNNTSFKENVILITTCGKGGGRSEEGAQVLHQKGFDARFLCGGTLGWFE